ncbi:hypothetical protein [Streptomyces chromofuscus]|uniref:Secreted protein n=1 Tax=Streptomyces chromofuscus TaxID=42881 RepID=A0A7M2T613_STRCW|nr:hypothetical protein [Streptomyces chromofuscus]QOV43704.1 hypothetical protein IPT68_28995 [Streptomyces chromofuscus]GGT35122.1 hypothetical protein GCM10010254_64420 [Streptomyces chromofuscus]
MKRLIRARRVRFCAAVTALVAFGFLGVAQHTEPARASFVTTADCLPQFGCDDTSWGG